MCTLIYVFSLCWTDTRMCTWDRLILVPMSMSTEDNDICGLKDWVPIPVNDSTTSITDLAVAVSNIPFGIFAFLSNLAIIVTVIKTPSLQRSSNILLCNLATANCLAGVTVQPIFAVWWINVQYVQNTCSSQQQLSTAFSVSISWWQGYRLQTWQSSAPIAFTLCPGLSPIAQKSRRKVKNSIIIST